MAGHVCELAGRTGRGLCQGMGRSHRDEVQPGKMNMRQSSLQREISFIQACLKMSFITFSYSFLLSRMLNWSKCTQKMNIVLLLEAQNLQKPSQLAR